MRPTSVQLLTTCLIDQLFPDTGMAVVTVLERLGLTVECPPAQTCCGQPAFNGGFVDEARSMARHTLDVFAATSGPVIIPSGSCAEMIVHHYPGLFEGDARYAQLAREMAARSYELTQFIVDVLGVTDVGAACEDKLAYHACCHGLRGLGVRAQPDALLAHVEGAQICPLSEDEACCGFGGLFAVKMPDISSAMLARKLDCVESSGAETLVVTDVSCAMHMAGGLRRRGSKVRLRHIADVLAGTKEPR